jgi:hypothetical protein
MEFLGSIRANRNTLPVSSIFQILKKKKPKKTDWLVVTENVAKEEYPS